MWKDYDYLVQCNNGKTLAIRVVAENREQAIRFVKKSYASSNTIYVDDRLNKWVINPL